MRMWMIDASLLCRQPLLGEHKEIHMVVGCLRKRKNINGYLIKGLIQLNALERRHNELALEMIKRGYNHKTPIIDIPSYQYINIKIRNNSVNQELSNVDLVNRCRSCKDNILFSDTHQLPANMAKLMKLRIR